MNRIETGAIASDAGARHAETIGDPPRILPLEAGDMNAAQIATIDRLNRAIGGTTATVLPEYFRTTVKHPALFDAQLDLGTVLFNGLIPARERELAVLRVGWLAQAPYEWGEHVLVGRRYGLTGDEVERVTRGSAAPGWSAHDAAVLRAVEELIADFSVSDATWDSLADGWTEAQLLEFPVLVGAYVTTAFQQNMVRMRLMPHNPGLTLR